MTTNRRAPMAATLVSASILLLTISCGDNGSSSGGGPYSVGGTVAGLDGTLVLQNNGADDLNVSADGPFTFATALDDGAAYEVTVLTQPAGQSCTVSNGSGTIAAARVDDVAVACSAVTASGWTHPAAISDGMKTAGGYPFGFQVGLSQNGDAVIAYYDLNADDHGGVFKAERRSGTWTYPASFDDDIGAFDQSAFRVDHNSPKVTVSMSDHGETLLTWVQYADYDGTGIVGDSVYKAEYRDTGANGFSWSSPTGLADRLNWGYGGLHEMGDSQMNGAGEAVIAWAQSSPSGQAGVYRADYDGSTWTSAQSATDVMSPSPKTHPTTQMPSVSINDAGDAMVAWSQRYSHPDDYRIMLSSYDKASKTWTHPGAMTDALNPQPGVAQRPEVVLGNNGDALVVWRQMTSTGARLYRAHYTVAGGWDLPVADEQIADSVSGHQVAMDDSGNAVVVWSASDGSDSRIYLTEYRGGAWTSPTAFSPAGSSAGKPQVAMSGKGDAVVVWRQKESSGTYDQLFMREYRNGAWSAMPALDGYISLDGSIGGSVTFSSEEAPHLAINDDGDTLIIWKQYDVANDSAEILFTSEFTSP